MSDDVNPFSAGKDQYTNSPNQMPAQPPPGNKSWVWILVTVVVLFVVMPVVCCGGFLLMSYRGIEAGIAGLQAPVEAAVEAMNDDPTVSAKLGAPIESESGFGVNEYNNDNGNGGASVDFDVFGPRETLEHFVELCRISLSQHDRSLE